ncbi:hypothetical protein GMAR_ORF175 [Golden Marseillevirus]|uniref:hypothetical protein n=1 Tax=Golden Marseillevirus TaxID=1720526 RepID=UPI000877AD99|nr:hypothetical protein GMAR_ORF175 [Golden Marseillevirus]ALX27549.1 hypothetical protein GMAR_ORF175 [Golden Marseillevirus]
MEYEAFDLEKAVSKIVIEPPDPILCLKNLSDQKIKLPEFQCFKKVLFLDCKNFVVECDQKLLTLGLVDCRNFVVKLHKGCVGNVDVFRSHFGKVVAESKVPFFQTELSSSIEYHTAPEMTTHIVTNSRHISQEQAEWSYLFPLNEWSERTFLMLEESNYSVWVMSSEQRYDLNEISQNVLV